MFRIRTTVLIQIVQLATTGLRIRIRLFSSVAFKMPTINNFFLIFCLLGTYLLQVHNITSKYETVEINDLLHFLNVDGRIRTNKYGSGRAKNLRILRIQNTVLIKFANDSTSELL